MINIMFFDLNIIDLPEVLIADLDTGREKRRQVLTFKETTKIAKPIEADMFIQF